MIKIEELPIPVYQMVFLQSCLNQIFTIDKNCENNFDYSEWYLREKFTEEEVNSVIEFFRRNGLTNDCDVVKKLNLKKCVVDFLNTTMGPNESDIS
jgi:hypothetical protein